MVRNAIPGQNNNSASWGKPYETDYQNIVNANAPAYNVAGDRGAVAGSARTDGDFNGSLAALKLLPISMTTTWAA